jgi:protein involved in polysaccharide export with SLBB domain
MGLKSEESLAIMINTVGRYGYRVTTIAIQWVALTACLFSAGCGWMDWMSGMTVSDSPDLAAFEAAGPVVEEVDRSRLVAAKRYTGAYRVVDGDLLELRMPSVMRVVVGGPNKDKLVFDKVEPYLIRVDIDGDITLPMVGKIKVGGKTLGEIEEAIAKAYHPKYLIGRPSVVAVVASYRTATVAVIGGVTTPGVYELRSNEMSLVALLMKAGGFAKQGASAIRIRRQGGDNGDPVILPVKDMNIPFEDVALVGGETVEVRQIDREIFTIVGLVNKPGAFPCSPDIDYTLFQAIGYAGGVNDLANPKYATIYRRDAAGQVVSAVFKFVDKKLTRGASIRIRPGDMIVIEPTMRTDVRQVFGNVFRVVVGATYNLNPTTTSE